MKTGDTIKYPYPVLGVGKSYKEELTKASRSVTAWRDNGFYYFDIELFLENEGILNCIEKGYAEYSFELSCPATFFREYHTSPSPKYQFIISETALNKSIDFSFSVVVKKPITDYKNDSFAREYPSAVNYEVGEVLAIFPSLSRPLNLSLANLRNPISLMQIEGSEEYEYVGFNADGEQILIQMPLELYNTYHPMSVERKKVAIKPIALSALTTALTQLEKGIRDNRDWALAIQFKIDENAIDYGFTSDDVLDTMRDPGDDTYDEIQKYAQTILNDPYTTLVTLINQMQDIQHS